MTPALRSLPAKTIARTLPVTLNTANDHIKATLPDRRRQPRRPDGHRIPGSQHARAVAGDPAKSPYSALAWPSRTHPVIRNALTLQRKGDRTAGSERHQQGSNGHQPEYRSAATCAWRLGRLITQREEFVEPDLAHVSAHTRGGGCGRGPGVGHRCVDLGWRIGRQDRSL